MNSDRAPRVVVLTHEHDRFERRSYTLRLQIEHWRRAGIEVVVVAGLREAPDADIALLHVDLTVVPAPYLEWMARYPVALNARTGDIRKRTISRQLVTPGDGYDGPVIVKTDLNCGGRRELRLLGREKRFGSLQRRLARWLPPTRTGFMNSEDYPVYASPREVPAAVFRSPHLVVERYRPERRDGATCVRSWMFLGDVDTVRLLYSRSPVVKVSGVYHREVLHEVPEGLRARRRELGFDYGKFDYAVIDGEVVLYDVSRTPTVSSNSPSADVVERNRVVAEGIRSFLPDRRSADA